MRRLPRDKQWELTIHLTDGSTRVSHPPTKAACDMYGGMAMLDSFTPSMKVPDGIHATEFTVKKVDREG